MEEAFEPRVRLTLQWRHDLFGFGFKSDIHIKEQPMTDGAKAVAAASGRDGMVVGRGLSVAGACWSERCDAAFVVVVGGGGRLRWHKERRLKRAWPANDT